MPRLEYFLVCESVSVDRDTNRISLFNVLENLHVGNVAPPGGVIVAQVTAVACFNRLDDEAPDAEWRATLAIHDPGGDTRELPLAFKMDRPRQRLLFRIQGGPASRDGVLRFELLLNGEHIADHTVRIDAPEETQADRNDQA